MDLTRIDSLHTAPFGKKVVYTSSSR